MDFRDEEMKVAIQRQAENTVKIEADRRNVEQENQTRVLEAEGQASVRLSLSYSSPPSAVVACRRRLMGWRW